MRHDNLAHVFARNGNSVHSGDGILVDSVTQCNAVFGIRDGFFSIREADHDPLHPNLHGIRVINLHVVDLAEFGMAVYRHPDESCISQVEEDTIGCA
ncbi:MAG: hypothetical protein R8G34_12235 [Paracoccaceae bacterium]|nr:hypothetical protein [Paracoccaceae bacterium]